MKIDVKSPPKVSQIIRAMCLTQSDRLALVRGEVNGGPQQLTVLLASEAARAKLGPLLKQWAMKYGNPKTNRTVPINSDDCFLDAFSWLKIAQQGWSWVTVCSPAHPPVLYAVYTGNFVPRIVTGLKAAGCAVFVY